MSLSGQQRIISEHSAAQLSEKLAGTNYKLVRIDDGGVAGPPNATHIGARHFSTPNQQAQLREYPPFELKYRKKPSGTAGKGPPKGYNLQDASGLDADHHAILGRVIESKLKATPGINMHATIDNQHPKSLVESVILSIAEIYTEFKMYEDDGHWLLRAYVYTTLKKSTDRFLRDQRTARIKMDPTQLEVQAAKQAKAKENAKARGQASARARKAKKEAAAAAAAAIALMTPTDVQVAALTEAEAVTNEGGRNTPVCVAREVLGDEVDNIAQDISMMSINIPSNGEELMDTDEGTFVLPADISGSAPTTQDPVTTISTPPEAPPASSHLQLPPTAVLNPPDMQNKLARLMVLSEEERAQLPRNLQHALALISVFNAEGPPTPAPMPAGTPAPNPVTVLTPRAHALALAPISTSTSILIPAPAPLVPVPPASPVTVADSSTMPISRQATKPRTINEIEPGPTTLQIDEDSLSELSSNPELPEEEENAKGKKAKAKTGSSRGRGSARGRGRGRGSGRGSGRSGGQPELANDVEPEPAPTTTRRLRSKK